ISWPGPRPGHMAGLVALRHSRRPGHARPALIHVSRSATAPLFSLLVGRRRLDHEVESTPIGKAHGAEVPDVPRSETNHIELLGERDDRGVDEPEPKAFVLGVD